MPNRNKRFLQNGAVVIFSFLLTILPMVSLIFFKVPKFVYMNMAGLFTFSSYFGALPSILYVILIQGLLILSRQADGFVSYNLMLNLIHVLIPAFLVRRDRPYYFKILVSALILTIFARPGALLLQRMTSLNFGDLSGLLNLQTMLSDLIIYLSSALISFVFFFCYDRLTKKAGR